VSRSSVLWWVAVAVIVVGAGVVLGRGRTSGPPLDPASTDPLGTRALVELVERFGADVTRRLPGDDQGPGGDGADDPATVPDAVLILRDELDGGTRDRLVRWVGDGGVLVVADPSSPLSRPPAGSTTDGSLPAGTCTVDTLAGLGEVEAGSFLRYAVEAGERSCFGTVGEAWLVARAEGSGTVVLLGGAAPLVNENLDEADNAAVVTGLLAPRPGARIVVLYDPVAGESGDTTLADLVPGRVWWAIAQLGVAFAVYVLWRARRFGRPVPEPQPVALPGSLLVGARGDLYRRGRSHQRVAGDLRRDAEHRVRRQLRLGADGPLPVAEIAARSGLEPAEVERLLVAAPPSARPGDVIRLAADLDRLLDRLEPETRDPRGASL
jgi:hypothetical protein